MAKRTRKINKATKPIKAKENKRSKKSAVAKKCIVVLGMHRSGTSAMTGLLSKLGASPGSDLLPANPSNPKGFFENKKL